MAWETRARGTRYYTRSRTVDGRVLREYVGGGLVGELAAMQDAERRAEREAKASAWRKTAEQLAKLDASVASMGAVVKDATVAALQAAGYHQHDRGEWRRRRYGS